MRSRFILLSIIICVLLSCKSKQKSATLNPNNLKSYFITLNSDSAYNLKTPQGASIKIAANSFDVAANTKITIEVKEAYSMQDILLAGLTTINNGKPLRSAGMIYFNATANNAVLKFNKPVQITTPAKIYDTSMQVFKGEVKDDSSINWITPKPTDTSDAVKRLLLGRSLFQSNCVSCHKSTIDFTGPALAGARQRAPNIEWPYKFINNVNVMLDTDPYAIALFRKYNSKMTQNTFSREQVKAILDYCDNEAGLTDLSYKDDEAICGYDTFYYPKQKENIQVLPLINPIANNSIDTVGKNNSIENIIAPDVVTGNNVDDEFEKKGYKYITQPQGMYQFNIMESGWSNIDVLMNDAEATQVILFGNVPMRKNDIELYLCIPKRKILVKATRHKGDIYLFEYSDAEGYLPLVLGDEAYMFGISSVADQLSYGITKFTVKDQRMVIINMKGSTKEALLKAINDNQLDGIKLGIEEKQMEIFEKRCDEQYPSTTSVAAPMR